MSGGVFVGAQSASAATNVYYSVEQNTTDQETGTSTIIGLIGLGFTRVYDYLRYQITTKKRTANILNLRKRNRAIAVSKINRNMQRIFAVVLIFLLVISFGIWPIKKASATTSFVQSTYNTIYTNTSVSATFSGNVTAGNVIAVMITWTDFDLSGDTLNSVTDSRGNTYTIVDNPTTGGYMRGAMAYAVIGSTGANTITATISVSDGRFEMVAHEISGVDTTTPLDNNQHQINYQASPGTGTDAVTSGNITTTQNGDYIFAATAGNGEVVTTAVGTGYNSRQAGTHYLRLSEDKVQTSAGSIAATFTIDTNKGMMTGIMAFKAPIPPDSTPPTVDTYSPVDNATGVSINSNLVLTFNENIAKGTGNILIKKTSDDSTIQTIDVTSGVVTINGMSATINPSDLAYSTGYYVTLASGVLTDNASPPNAFAGISDKTTWNFTTAAPNNYSVKADGSGNFTTIQACVTAMAAGETCTVYAGTYNEHPTLTAGTSGNLKTITVNSGDNVKVYGFTMASYTVVDGFEITGSFADRCIAVPANATTFYITNNNIHSCGNAQAIREEYNANTTYGYIQNNTIAWPCSTPPAPASGSACAAMLINGDYHLIENNDISHVSDGISLYGQHNVIRGNTLHDVRDTDWAIPNDPLHVDFIESQCDATKRTPIYNLYENNYMYDNLTPDSHAWLVQDGGGCPQGTSHQLIIRFNRISNIGSYNLLNNLGGYYGVKHYNNTIVNLSRPNWDTVDQFADSSTYGAELNNIFYNLGGPNIDVYNVSANSGTGFNGGYNLAYCESGCNFSGRMTTDTGNIINQNPYLINPLSNFQLQSGSPAIDAGTNLTTVAGGDTGSGTSLAVNDAGYFQDGSGIVDADWIAVGTVSNVVQISSIDYSTNVITLASSISRNDGDPVYLYKNSSGTQVLAGSAPDIGAYEFTTDVSAPIVDTYSPVDGATSVDINFDLVMTFNENMAKGTGNILIKKTSDDSTVQTIDVTSGTVTVSTNTVTINPSDFDYSTGYYVNMASGVLTDTATTPNAYAGISNATTWNFTTTVIPPTLTTSLPTLISTSTLTLNSNISSIGGASVTQSGFAYGTVSGLSTVISTTTLGVQSTGDFSQSLSSLLPNTLYYFRAYATNLGGTSYGSILSTTTLATSSPAVTTQSVSSITATTATGNGTITATGYINPTARGVSYGLTTAYGATTTSTGDFSAESFTSSITELTCGTTYHVRAYATNSEGTGYGDDVTFTTSACPVAETPATSVTSTSQTTSSGSSATTRMANLREIYAQNNIPCPESVCGGGSANEGNVAAGVMSRAAEIIGEIIPGFMRGDEGETLEIVVPRETPVSLKSDWDFVNTLAIRNFVLSPLPEQLTEIADKYPEINKMFAKLGISTVADLDRLRGTSIDLPDISNAKDLPTDVVIAQGANGKVPISSSVTVDEKGKVEQRVRAIANTSLTLAVKPGATASAVTGYLVFLKSGEGIVAEMPFNRQTASALTAIQVSPAAKPALPDRELLVQEFPYQDSDRDGVYTADITTPAVEGTYEVITMITYTDKTLGTKQLRLTTVIDPEGYVYEKIDGKEARIPEVSVSIFSAGTNALWDAVSYNQTNPQITNESGKYSFLVPEGSYYITAQRNGYKPYKSDVFEVRKGSGVHFNIEMKSAGWFGGMDWKAAFLLMVIAVISSAFAGYALHEHALKRKLNKRYA